MKTKLSRILIIITCIALTSCDVDVQQESNELLTSAHWTIEQKPLLNGETPKFTEKYIFHKDGSYTLESGYITIGGQWKWTDQQEIYLQIKTLNIKGENMALNQKQNSYIRILEVNENTLKTLERYEGDAWDSGFAKEITYSRI